MLIIGCDFHTRYQQHPALRAPILLLLTPETRELPCVRHLESLQYSQAARMGRVQGEVRVSVTISPNGKVMSADASSGPPILRRDAEENVKRWSYSTGREATFDVTYMFRLEEPEVDYIPPTRMAFDLPDQVLVISKLPKPND